ncbi:MAG: methyltransferase [Acidiferrobacteraceae bacterium]|jgi:trimethylamine--corrinoid protein Co-methyltransferase|nr:methyltransferase [Acidiferrobacteraceae bacterium]MDP7516393.1 trimethylamine methyltransferase family protein [Arenicellales bacterium]|tara:strand:- start:1032 stop:2600 length:1569 start_codon:yes stop_codon:yes gene_type:complete
MSVDPLPRRRGSRRKTQHRKEIKPAIWPGLEGGAYKPLSEADMGRIHASALDILADIGMGGTIPVIVEAARGKGLNLDSDGRLRFPRSFTEDIIANACHSFTLRAIDEKHNIDLGGAKVHFSAAGEAVSMLDFHSGKYRPSTLLDIYDTARLVDTLDNVHRYGNVLVPTDIEDLREFALNRTYATLAATGKLLGLTVMKPEYFDDVIAMLDMIVGSEGDYLKSPFGLIGACPVISPLTYGEDSAALICEATCRGIPTMSVIAGQAGATAPASLAGALAQNTAETLASLIMVNLIRPGHPMIFGNWPFVSDLRTGSFSGGSGEEAVLAAAAVQMGKFYNLPRSVGAGMTDSKVPDAQAGYEKGLTIGLAANTGANLIMESCGMTASLLGASLESMVIDNEILGNVLRSVRGIEINDETLNLGVIREAVNGAGHYLGAAQTLELMHSEYVYPELADRSSPEDWQDEGSLDMQQRAREKAQQILTSHFPAYIPPDSDQKIRERFPIRLDRQEMKAGSSRWCQKNR